MIEIPLKKYCEMTGQSRQGVYNKIKDGNLDSRKDDSGRVFILLDIDVEEKIKEQSNLSQVKEVFGALIVEMKEQNKELIDKLEESHKREIDNLKEVHQKLLEMKEDEISRLREKGFFQRLFGG